VPCEEQQRLLNLYRAAVLAATLNDLTLTPGKITLQSIIAYWL
jgi:hypothetical protein